LPQKTKSKQEIKNENRAVLLSNARINLNFRL
jgi:hypothetical protein